MDVPCRLLGRACNLVAASWTETENACGEDVRLIADPVGSVEQTSMNQEPNINQGHQCQGLFKFRATGPAMAFLLEEFSILRYDTPHEPMLLNH